MSIALLALFHRLGGFRLLRYLIASVGALAVDMGAFLALLKLGMAPVGASAISYSLGIAAHWLMSSRAVFTDTVAQRGAARNRQKALFVGSALVGLAITTLVVWAGDGAGMDPRIAKLIAIGAAFTATWLLRAKVVFRP